jgi:hypothetical protein
MPSYFFPRRYSLFTNFRASSTIHRIGRSVRQHNFWFSRANVIEYLEASTWVTRAPAPAADNVAKPVYPNKLRMLGGRDDFRI